MKTPTDPLIRAIDDARLLRRMPAYELSDKAGYGHHLWENWTRRPPMQIKALQEMCQVLGLEIVVRPKSLDSTGPDGHLSR
jgi:hypothetical protein